jgi:uncharacterized membrane protein
MDFIYKLRHKQTGLYVDTIKRTLSNEGSIWYELPFKLYDLSGNRTFKCGTVASVNELEIVKLAIVVYETFSIIDNTKPRDIEWFSTFPTK